MIVVADSSPLIVLVNIGQIKILPALFATVIIRRCLCPHQENGFLDFGKALG